LGGEGGGEDGGDRGGVGWVGDYGVPTKGKGEGVGGEGGEVE